MQIIFVPELPSLSSRQIQRAELNIDYKQEAWISTDWEKKTVDLLFNKKLINNISDLYDLRMDQLIPA